jgi:hypothetical protein
MRGRRVLRAVAVAIGIGIGAMAAPAAMGYDIQPVLLTCGDVVTTNVTLAADIGPCAGDGLVIGAPHVTVDLNGHSITGKHQPGTAGIRHDSFDGVTVKNGNVYNFFVGVHFKDALNVRAEGLNVRYNSWAMVFDDTPNVVLTDNDVSYNSVHGIKVEKPVDAVVKGNTLTANGSGISVGFSEGISIVGNVVTETKSTGINVQGVARLKSNIVTDGETHGLVAHGDDVVIRANTVSRNGYDGIVTSGKALVSLNKTNGNGFKDGVDDNDGFGIQADKSTRGGDNVAKKNDDAKQCFPKALCA